jgi:hypothetical protein
VDVEIQPTAKELLAIVGCLWAELDNLRERVSQNPVAFNKRTFTYHDLTLGASLGIKGRVLTNGNIVISTDS